MGALTQPRVPVKDTLKVVSLVLAGSTAVYQGGRACLDQSAHVCTKGAAGNANLIPVGLFVETIDNSGTTATSFVSVELDREIVVQWFDNATGGAAVTSSNLYANVYILDDHTVTNSSSGNSVAGRVWAIDPVRGVAIQETNT